MNTWRRTASGWANGVTDAEPGSYDVLLLGSYFCDLIFTGLPGVPRLGADLFGTEFDMVPGASYRTALACRRLGLRAGWLCDFGTDFFSRFVLDMAAQDGLDMSLFRHHPVPVRRVSAAFSFVHDRGFESGYSVAIQLQSIRLQMRHVAEPNEMRDEPQPRLPLLQLAE